MTDIKLEIIFDPTVGVVKGVGCEALPNRIIMKGVLTETLRVLDDFYKKHEQKIIAPPPGLDVSVKQP